MELVAFLGKDIENYGQVSALINKGEWDKSIVVKTKESGEFAYSDNEIIVDSSQPISILKEEIQSKLKSKIDGAFEVAVSLASGNGKEHMAFISALLNIPVGIKLVVFTKQGIQYLS
jgi:hypothetical protein